MKISYPLATVLEIILPEHVGPKAVPPDLELCSGGASEHPGRAIERLTIWQIYGGTAVARLPAATVRLLVQVRPPDIGSVEGIAGETAGQTDNGEEKQHAET